VVQGCVLPNSPLQAPHFAVVLRTLTPDALDDTCCCLSCGITAEATIARMGVPPPLPLDVHRCPVLLQLRSKLLPHQQPAPCRLQRQRPRQLSCTALPHTPPAPRSLDGSGCCLPLLLQHVLVHSTGCCAACCTLQHQRSLLQLQV
jgi:hypothetical protein